METFIKLTKAPQSSSLGFTVSISSLSPEALTFPTATKQYKN